MSNRLIKAIQKTGTLHCSCHNSILTSALYLEKFKKYNDNQLDEIIQNNDICLTSYRIDVGLNLYLSNIYSAKNVCDMKKKNNEALEFGKKLENEGHTCVKYMETYPVQIYWCGNKQCDKQ